MFRSTPQSGERVSAQGASSSDETLIKCLLVDDLDENLLATSALLQRPGLQILAARSGEQALEILLEHDVALALLDVQMPRMDGFELAEVMRGSERSRHIPIIFVTAGARDMGRQFRGYERGAVDFLYKPIDPVILLNKASVFFDLHRQKLQLARELREKSRALELNEMFMAVLGHDLRNPLNAILMRAQLLRQRSEEAVTRECAESIDASGRRMARLITDLLDVARARQGGEVPLHRTSMVLAETVARVVAELEAAHSEIHVAVTTVGDTRGWWDGDRLAQAASNLIANALQHGRQDAGVQVEVDGRARDSVTLTVANAGEIEDRLLPHLFDPLTRNALQPERKEGLGLGLHIVQQIVEAHQGAVRAASAHDTTTLTVSLPRRFDAMDHSPLYMRC